MKRAVVILTIFVLILSIASEVSGPIRTTGEGAGFSPLSNHNVAAASGNGDGRDATQFFTRKITSQQMDILNTFAATATHQTELSLIDYQVSGWRLSEVKMDIENIDASAEREVVGQTYENLNFQVAEVLGTFRSQIAQGFYNYPHNGVLMNYSIYYITDRYSPPARGNASLVVRSGNQIDTASDITTPENMTASEGIFSWVTVSGENATLSSNTLHWIVVDGRQLYEAAGYYPTIFWTAENTAGTYPSEWYDPPPENEWDIRTLEALLNYTYIPWNQTANAPLTYSSPQQVDLKGNSSVISSSSFSFYSSTKNITSITFDTNQSVHLTYDVTLSYVKTSTASSSWDVASSGGVVDWDTTLAITYPSVSGQISRFLNLSVANSWDTVGLYESAAPTTNHTDYTRSGNVVTCSSMTDGSWSLTATSYNHLASVGTFDSSDDSVISSLSSILVDMDVNLTLQEEDLDSVTTGLANLTISKGGSTIWAPSNKSVLNGAVNYLWNIDSTTSDNGAFTLELSWANGTDAGYLTSEITVFYPTSLTTSTPSINAFTESTFDVSVYFEDTATPQGLDAGYANVVYSFDNGVNTSLTDSGGGTWTATIPTTGKVNDTYTVVIYAEGYALENQSIRIDVTLIHDTQPLVITWSDTNNISYVESTILSVEYRTVGGSPVTDATVNVTDGSSWWELIHVGSGIYNYTFNGSNPDLDFSTHDLTIQAWQMGYKNQSDSTTLTIHRESTTIDVIWIGGSSITFVEDTTLSVNYTMSDGSAVLGAEINVTIGTGDWDLIWNGTTQTYDLRIFGDAPIPGLGNHTVNLFVGRFGYANHTDNSETLSIDLEPTSILIDWFDGNGTITYVQQTTLVVTFRMNSLAPISGAVVNATDGVTNWELELDSPSRTYRVTLFGWNYTQGLGSFNLTIRALKTGYIESTGNTTLTIIEDPTTIIVSWSGGINNITYVENTILIVSYRMNDTTPIDNASVIATILGIPYPLSWHNDTLTYRYNFTGADSPPGFGTFNLTISAYKFGFRNNSNMDYWITLRAEPTSIDITWLGLDSITYLESTILSINYTMQDGSPVTDANVTVAIGSDSWLVDYDIDTKTYRVQFLGTDEPPGLGLFTLDITASLFGFETRENNTVAFAINPEPTSLVVSWDPDDDISFATYSILYINYTLLNTTPVPLASVNLTIDTDYWEIPWNATSQRYQLRINGSDLPPGFANHSMIIQASKKGFVYLNTTDYVQLRIESTSLVIEWSNGYELGFFDYTYLFVDYRNEALGTIYDADINVTIGTYTWIMTWNNTAVRYQIRFNGSDSNPGVGNHDLLIKAGKIGYTNLEDSSKRLILPAVPTTLVLEFTNGNDISYVDQTTLRVYYRMYNVTPVLLADVNVTVAGLTHPLTWNVGTGAYEYTFYGSDRPPGFGNHSLVVLAGARDFESQSNSSTYLNLKIESSSLDISWSNGYNITYFNQTTLSVRYLMSDQLTPIDSAYLNVTINNQFYELHWNATTNAYEATILGADDPPGYGTYDVTILASRFGFETQTNDTFDFTIRVEDTYLRFKWVPKNVISYVNATTLKIYYLMTGDTPIINASVNAKIGPTQWQAEYNNDTDSYDVYFEGTDFSPPVFRVIEITASKINYLDLVDTSQNLTINSEQTAIEGYWTNGNSITFIDSTTLLANFTMSNGTTIISDIWTYVEVVIGSDSWELEWDSDLKLYKKVFTGADEPPGLGYHGVNIRGFKPGYQTAENSSLILIIEAEDVGISSSWLGNSTITYVQTTTLEVNYTTSEGIPIIDATVNVTIDTMLWNLTWHQGSQTYRITFNGTDNPPGFGINHQLIIRAWKAGFNGTTDTSKRLSITEESTTLTFYWSDPHQNNVSYFDYTYLFVNYRMSNGSDIIGADVNVTYDGTTWFMEWNSTEVAFGLRFNGSDNPPGLGTKALTIKTSEFGFDNLELVEVTLILRKDPTSLEVNWPTTNNISYVEQTLLMVYYRTSNNSLIFTGTLTASIGEEIFLLVWNVSTGAYHFLFTGDMDPPDLGTHTVIIHAYADIYANSTTSTSLKIEEESTVAYASWITETIDWTERLNLSIDYRDSYGRLIEDASQKVVSIDGVEYVLLGTNGTYWFELNNSFDLGLHTIEVNISKYGYNFAVNTSISLNITHASTILSLVWNATTIDYLGQINLEVTYAYSETGEAVPMGSVEANLTIDGTTDVPLEQIGLVWVANLTGYSDLDLGTHEVIIRTQAYGYVYQEVNQTLIVNPVNTDGLEVTWSPSNVTIEYTEWLNLTVDYTFYDGDVPTPAFVNVTINGRFYDLDYLGGVWTVSILGEELDIGVYTASISAWAYGYADRTNLTIGINVTLAANAFKVSWNPWDLNPTYLDTINVSVRYLEDFKPILDATVILSINGTPYELTYNSTDEMWHISFKAKDIGLGVWNATLTANKTGYADGWDSFLLSISPVTTNITVVPSATSIYYDEDVTIDIYYQLLNTSYVPGATLTLELDGEVKVATWDLDHWTYTESGSVLGLGTNPVYIHVVAFGFEAATNTSINIDVIAIPTSVTTPAPSVSIFAYETTTVLFTWTDVKNSVNIAGFIPEVEWPDTYSVVDLGNGNYTIEIDSTALHVRNYVLQVNFTGTGYASGSQLINIEIMVLPLSPIFESEIVQFENETISIVIQLFESPHATVVDWAEILIELDGIQYSLVYDNVSEHYSVEIWLATLAPGSYMLNFTASATDCETEYGEIQLEIEPKVMYTLVLEVDEEVRVGQIIQIIILASYESGQLENFQVTVHIIVERGELAPQEFVEVASDMLEFNVPHDATGLTIWAEFEGAEGEWPAISNTVNREVAPGGFDILSFIFSLFEDPVTLTIIVGGGGGSIAGLILLRRRRGSPKVSKPATTGTPTPSVAPAAPKGEMDLLQDEIKQSPVGMTRIQIAKSLDISKSKASALVQKLLESDTGFEEVTEGRLRRIRFRSEE